MNSKLPKILPSILSSSRSSSLRPNKKVKVAFAAFVFASFLVRPLAALKPNRKILADCNMDRAHSSLNRSVLAKTGWGNVKSF